MSLLDLLKEAEKRDINNTEVIRKMYVDYFDAKARDMGCPQGGIFELTPFCNFDCKMCYVHLNRTQLKGQEIISTKDWIRIIEEAIDAGMMHCQLTGGEAMLHPGFDEIYMHLYNNGINTAVMTNGLLLTDERIEFFKTYRPGSLQITLYGSSEEGYEKLTGVRAYEIVKQNILKAKEVGCRLIVSGTPSAYFGVEDVKNLISFARDNDLNYRLNNDLNIPREDTGRDIRTMELSVDDYIKIFKLRLEAEGIEAKAFEDELPKAASDDVNIESDIKCGLRCSAGRSLFCINWKGEMMACLDLPFAESLKEQSFQKAWESIHKQATEYVVPSECFSCLYNRNCTLCPVIHGKNAPQGHVDKAICARTKRMVREGIIKL